MLTKKLTVCLGVLALMFAMFAFGVSSVNAQVLNPKTLASTQSKISSPTLNRPGQEWMRLRRYQFMVYTMKDTALTNDPIYGSNTYPVAFEIDGSAGGNDIERVQRVQAATNGTNFPNLYELLRLGGTIELAMRVGPKGSTTHTIVSDGDGSGAASESGISAARAASFAYRLIITEVMWGLDLYLPVEHQALAQWVEYSNQSNVSLKHQSSTTITAATDVVVLIFTPNIRLNRVGKKIEIHDLPSSLGGTPDGDLDLGETFVVVDMVSTIDRFGNLWALKGNSGNTQTIRDGDVVIEPTDLVSMYRKMSTNFQLDRDPNLVIDGLKPNVPVTGLGHGGEASSWAKSEGRVNLTGSFVGSPGGIHVFSGGIAGTDKTFPKTPASIGSTGVILNEVRNDTSQANLDWVELYHNTDAAGATPQNLENWTLSIVTRTLRPGKKETDPPTGTDNPNTTADEATFDYVDENLFSLPKYKLLPGEYLVIYNRHPGETALAGGVNIEDVLAGKQVNKGSKHLYFVNENWSLPSDKKFLLLLRSGNDKRGTHEKVVDYAGNGFFKRVESLDFRNPDGSPISSQHNTDVWPFIGWSAPGDLEPFGDNTFASATQSFGRIAALTDKGVYRPKSRNDNRTHKDDWQAFGFTGAGYDRNVDPLTSPGTPGYQNGTVNITHDDREGASGKSAYRFGGTVTISEIMYDAGPRWNLVQWIELYNSSRTETVNIGGWTMEIRNESTDVESYVDSSFKFEADTEILPNQTLLLVSGPGVNDVPQERVYNLYENHRRELGLVARDSRLLSREGFYIRLTSKIMEDGREIDRDDLSESEISKILMDEVGNVEVQGAARHHMWDLPPRDPAVRHSLVRQYETRTVDGNGHDAKMEGTMQEAWNLSILGGAALTFYGHRNDIGTPGFRLGGPLPVSLSSFRPVRDTATGHVVVRWITQSELNNAGFNILRSESRRGEFTVANVKGIIPGHGTTSEKHVYAWTDTTAKPNVVYYYQIEDVSLDGKRTLLTTTRLKGHVSASGKLTTTWANLKGQAQ